MSTNIRHVVGWFNQVWAMKVWQILGIITVAACGFGLVIYQQESNDAADRNRDRLSSIQRLYDSDVRAWENDLRQYEQCLTRIEENDNIRVDLLSLNDMLRKVIQVIEDANPATDLFGPLFDVVADTRADIEARHAPFPPDYCPAAPPLEPARPPELSG